MMVEEECGVVEKSWARAKSMAPAGGKRDDERLDDDDDGHGLNCGVVMVVGVEKRKEVQRVKEEKEEKEEKEGEEEEEIRE
ncbi:hypothetical protein M0R45_035787 [Rubus argutus]|uniref:Uncharacterized protein n=1 Tax=Rubus argutus TaxID=59490 RepID=A0AAW1VXX6_RUBAR